MSKMIFENDNCPVCFCEYEITNEDEDDYDKVKKYIPVCGHMLCEECRDEIMFCCDISCCPICRVEWDNDFYDDDHLEYPENNNNSDSEDEEENIDEEERQPYFSGCEYCKHSKLDPEELETVEQLFYFKADRCGDCEIAYLIYGD
jgi:hypothetical protein